MTKNRFMQPPRSGAHLHPIGAVVLLATMTGDHPPHGKADPRHPNQFFQNLIGYAGAFRNAVKSSADRRFTAATLPKEAQ
jgi:hypothetical protein